MTYAAVLAGIALAAVLISEHRRRRRQAAWRARHEARWAAMQERRVRANSHPHTGEVEVQPLTRRVDQ